MISRYKVKKSSYDIEPQEIFLDRMAHVKEEELGLSEKKLEVPLQEKISYVMFGIFLLLAIILFSRTFYFQILEGKKMAIAAENNKGSANIIVPERGIIYDKNMVKLVSNSPAFDLACSRAKFSSGQESNEISQIAIITQQDPMEIANKIQSSDSSQVLVAEDISHENLLVLETKMDDLPDCQLLQNTKRDYLYGPVLSHLLGYTGRINKDEYSNSAGYSVNDYIGKTGLEAYYENNLRGSPGEQKLVKKNGKQSLQTILQPEAGQNLVLNIDEGMQQELYNSMIQTFSRMGAKKGAAVAMDPRTGAVLALVSYPSYDDNLFSGGISQQDYQKLQSDQYQPLFDRVIAAHYPTGSTIKPLEASAALQENLISPDKQIDDIGYILVKSQYDPSIVYRFGGVEAHGWVDMKKALAVSSNIYFYTVGGGYGDQKGLGPARIKKYLSLFGWDNKTGIDLPGEFSGFIPDPAWKKAKKGQGWYDGDTYNLSIGQSDLQTTPLQVATAYCAIANGGTLYKPQIASKIIENVNGKEKVVQEFKPQIIRSGFIDAKNLQIVREGMRDGVAQPYGLSKSLNNLPVSVAAKTGTAEIGYQNQFNVWSSVFAPYEDPQIVLVVTAENVNGLGAVTLPVAHDVLNYYFSKK